MAGSKLSGALRWSAAEEVSVRISAVRSKIASAASGEADAAGKQLRSGLAEIDSIRQFIHDGINMCNRQYLDGGSRDAVLQRALESGLSELEDVRSRLVASMNMGLSRGSAAADSSGAAAPPPNAGSVRRPPSAPTTRAAVQREIDMKKQQRAANEQQRKSFLERLAGGPPADPQPTASGGTTAATSRPTSATQRSASAATAAATTGNGAATPQQTGGMRSRPTSATVRGHSAATDARTPVDSSDVLRPTASWTAGHDQPPQPAPPQRSNSGSATTPASAGLKFRPSSAPSQRPAKGVEQEASSANTGATVGSGGGMGGSNTTATAASDTSAWGKYQDWAQSVLSRVQSRRVMQHRQALQKQRENERAESIGGGGSTPTNPTPPPAGTGFAQQQQQQQQSAAVPSTPSSSSQQPPRTTSAANLTQGIVQGNLRRARPSTAGLTPSGGLQGSASTTTAGGQVRPQSAKLNPQAQLLREQGNVLFQQKKYRESAEAYSRAIECDPHSETLYCNRAAACLMLNKYHDALQDSLKAIEFDPTHVKAHWRAAKAYLYLSQSEEAKSMYLQAHRLAAIQTESDAIDAEMKAVDYVDRARRCLKGREWQEALRLADLVLEVFPPSGPCSMPWQCLRAEAMIHVDAHEACNLLAQMTADEPSSAEAWYLRAKALFYTGHDGVSTNSCLGFLQKSREIEPSNKAAALQLCIETFSKLRDEGNAAYSAGRWQDAHTAYTRCLTVDAYNTSLKAIILCNRAAVSIQCEKWKDALDDINQSIAFNPHNAKAYTRRARIYQHNAQFDLAVKDLQLAVQMYPSAENQERLAQAVEMKNQAARQNAQKQQQYQQQAQQGTFGGGGGSFRYFGFASSGSSSASGFSQQQQQRPNTAGARRPQSAGYGGESNNNAGSSNALSVSQRAKSYYEILCVSRTSDEKTIVRAYRDAALKWHPDKWASATAEQKLTAENLFKEISVAYNTLKDPQKRRQYDLTSPN